MALTAQQTQQIKDLVSTGDSLGAVNYLIEQGLSRPSAQRRVADAQAFSMNGRIYDRGLFEERDLITRPQENQRFYATDAGMEYIYSGGEWLNSAGFPE